MNASPFRPSLRSSALIVTGLMTLLVGGYLGSKVMAGRAAEELAVDWNADRTCSITTYSPTLGEGTFLNKLFHLIAPPTFFRVYDKEGRLQKSSEWLLWQREAGELEAPRWMGNAHVLYPTTQGYAEWSLPGCARR
jgi:hypothetical protein